MSPSPLPLHPGADPVKLYEPITGDRTAFWRHLRQVHGEVAPALIEPGVPAWLLLSYGANRQVMADDATFKRDPRHWHDLHNGRIGPDAGVRATWHKRPTALLSDGEEHRHLSTALTGAFAQLDAQRTLGRIADTAHRLIDTFAVNGQADLMGQYARLLPLHVLCRLMGMSTPEVARITGCMSQIWAAQPGAMKAVHQMQSLLLQVARQGRTAPDPHSLPSLLVQQGLTEAETAEQLGLIVSAAADPVTHTIGQALRQLLTDAALASAYGASTLQITETVNLVQLRHSPMETLVARFPARDVEIGGRRIRAGDCLVFGFASASDEMFGHLADEDAASNRAHLTFGLGAHRCPRYGRDLALAMAETAIATLFDRLPDVRLTTPPEQHLWLPGTQLRGLASLPAAFTPATPRSEEPTWATPPAHPSSSTRPGPDTTPTTKPAHSRPQARLRRWFSPAAWKPKP